MSVRIIEGDCRAVLASLPDASVQMCVTSPPYFGLRDYGTASWEGGDADCDHKNGPLASPKSTLQGYTSDQVKLAVGGMPFGAECGKCGATRIDQQIGLESTVEEYVAELVAVFREVRRLLRDDGVLFLNLGDSYVGNPHYAGQPKSSSTGESRPGDYGGHVPGTRIKNIPSGLKPKDLIGIPWRVAFALQADGWYLRSDIIWAKPNPMPESVTDRPTKSHEYIFLLTKSARYFWDQEAVKEEANPAHLNRYKYAFWPDGSKEASGSGRPGGASNTGGMKEPDPTGRNIRSVWTIATAPFAEAHFATFPPALAERCIKAGSAVGTTVLDPFGGAGTVGLVADRLDRDAILIELNPEYAAMARRRITNDAPLFAVVGD